MNSEPLPDIWEADWEFTRLAQYLGMADHDMSGCILYIISLSFAS